MKLYVLYIVTAVLNFYAIMVFWGVSAGFANYFPIVSVISSLLLFLIAAPVVVFNSKWGVILGLVFSLAMIPYSIMYIIATIGDSNYHSLISLLFNIPYLLPFVIVGYTGRSLIKKDFHLHFPSALVSKVVLCATPILLFVAYIVFISKGISYSR